MGLVESHALLVAHLEQNGGILGEFDVETTSLVPDLESALPILPGTSWAATDNLRVWSFGFFLNKAMQNIAAALDRVVNTWLERRLSVPAAPHPSGVHFVFYDTINTRLRLIEVLRTQEPIEEVRLLRAEFDREPYLWDTIVASQEVARLAKRLADKQPAGLTKILNVAGVGKNGDREATIVLWGLVNAFKHVPVRQRTTRWEVIVEWVLAKRSFTTVCKLADSLLSDPELR